MRLTLKLALAVLPGALVVVAAAAFLELRRDRAEFEADQRVDDLHTAGAFADSMGKMWESVGEPAVHTAMDRIGAREGRYRARRIDPRADVEPTPGQRAALGRGESVLWHDARGEAGGWLHAVPPLQIFQAFYRALAAEQEHPEVCAAIAIAMMTAHKHSRP